MKPMKQHHTKLINQVRKTYSAPKLYDYGDVRSLTQAGTQGQPEGGSGRQDKKA